MYVGRLPAFFRCHIKTIILLAFGTVHTHTKKIYTRLSTKQMLLWASVYVQHTQRSCYTTSLFSC
jgi:hypothetical protein